MKSVSGSGLERPGIQIKEMLEEAQNTKAISRPSREVVRLGMMDNGKIVGQVNSQMPSSFSQVKFTSVGMEFGEDWRVANSQNCKLMGKKKAIVHSLGEKRGKLSSKEGKEGRIGGSSAKRVWHKGPMFRVATAVLARSSSAGMADMDNDQALEEARKMVNVGKSLGISFKGKENEVLQRIVELEKNDAQRDSAWFLAIIGVKLRMVNGQTMFEEMSQVRCDRVADALENGQGNLLTNLPLHPHPFATLIHSAMFLNNGVAINSRKRRREVADTELSLAPTNLFSLQPPPPPPTPTPSPPPQPPPQKMCTPLPLPLPFLSFTSMLTEDRTAQIVEQSDQIDEIIKTHADQLRRTLADKWQRHYSTLICAAEERASKRLKERELECELTVRRNAELEQRAAQYSEEAHVWQAKARKLEQTAASLRAALRQQANVHGGRRE
ncbi:hypothetical protein LOK49_LG07G00685 [Camellia lanceoleosa]|uniref:Uncharacterized protein n=1 Tax=Camellia lanceoleosa TaxID=1840588 RepID=A0ACC0H2G3_9ERIC|nr:hypothetical protein LOK49_LG07G00685 [Camellia lanceoleosa]